MSEKGKHGRFAWHELMTTDTKAAIDYYGKVLKLGTMPFEHDPSYTMFTAEGVPVGGLMTLPEEAKAMGAPPHWLSYVTVTNVDDTVAKAKELGATVYVEPRDILNAGRFAVLADPQGATFAVHASSQPMPDTGDKIALGDVSWHELATTDWEAAWKFYEAIFGWEKTDAMDMGPGGTYQMFGFEGKSSGGMYNKPREMPAPPHWLPYATVKDTDATAKQVEKLGGKVLNGPMEVPGGGRIAQCMDPQGAAFAIYAEPAAVKPEPKPRAVRKPAKPVAKAAKRKAAKKKTKRVGRTKRR